MTRTARIVSLCLGAWVTACSSSGVKGDESAELTSDTDESSATDASSDGGDGGGRAYGSGGGGRGDTAVMVARGLAAVRAPLRSGRLRRVPRA